MCVVEHFVHELSFQTFRVVQFGMPGEGSGSCL